jgi:hypothetical protein
MTGRNGIVKTTAGAVRIGKSRDRPGCSRYSSLRMLAKRLLENRNRCLKNKPDCKLKFDVCKLKGGRLATRRPLDHQDDKATPYPQAHLARWRDFSKWRFLRVRISQGANLSNGAICQSARRVSAREVVRALAKTCSPLAAQVKKPTLPSKKLLSTLYATKNF